MPAPKSSLVGAFAISRLSGRIRHLEQKLAELTQENAQLKAELELFRRK